MSFRVLTLAGPLLLILCRGPIFSQTSAHSKQPPKKTSIDPARKSLIDDLVLANRILASGELGFLDPFGHVSVRDPDNPQHYYMARYVSAGMVTASDVIEYDLDSNPVGGPRSDNFNERFIHGEIYKARPDVMAVVHSHTPELVAFSVSSIPLRPVMAAASFLGDGVPVFDIRTYTHSPNVGIVANPELGAALAKELGSKGAILLYAHGAVTVESSLVNLVARADYLREDAMIQQQAILLGGTVNYIQPGKRPVEVLAPRPAQAPPKGGGGASGADRAWDYWKHLVAPQATRAH
jgi:ribulose-5-phosphate 4-epimerase/fuculose-1-phosphate aldolase